MNTAQILPDLRRISLDGSLLYDFVEKFPESSHIREMQTKKYLMVNHHMVSDCGLQTVDDIIGYTQNDIWFDSTIQKKRSLSQTTISSFKNRIKKIDKIENQVLSTKHSVTAQCFFLNSRGHVGFETVVKTGIQNHEGKMIAFLTICICLTHQVPLSTLLKIYQVFYPHKEAIQKFLSHFNIESYFDPHAPLTQKEIEVLIAMRENSRCKVIANKFGCSVPTASSHISNIHGKLTSGTLHDVLHKLSALPEDEQIMYAV
ncbi:putative transcriptional regulator [Candidatus Glomeribacter gigasporarum BEG34]|uniref:Putative transcriptional regulator n=1 Tax=Candidatus Glomeribacter gigasporarum BEG34 TaxID=1070319 RepID=G2J7J1_9BURK|nr:helix-turn-helix transcriptional regulator [Candidatus Glomeribacter gigasporarum]CCD28736.1 putative transcriptional regulator [Candidatus Glomeribacter gigasporarum BEG34]